ncbi:MAG: cytochrome c oxidase subunit 3 family protein [bacterium]|nr:cytochrome c oxidase subunit 3 family protein [bacterium]
MSETQTIAEQAAGHDAHHDEHGHNPYLAHHFDTEEQQYDSNKLGMWLFLATEVLLFSGLFCAYSVYRANHPEIFIYAHQFLDKFWGGLNTVILIFSSFTMAWAVRNAQLNQKKLLIINLTVTLICAACFLGVKYIEYSHKWHEGLLWGQMYSYQPGEHGAEHGAEAVEASEGHSEAGAVADQSEQTTSAEAATGAESAPTPDTAQATDLSSTETTENGALKIETSKIPEAAEGPAGLAKPVEGHDYGPAPQNIWIFFGIYFTMTGLHGLHVIGGMCAISWLLFRAIRGEFNERNFVAVDCVGLYWHVVDLVWIYLFPLLYLIH